MRQFGFQPPRTYAALSLLYLPMGLVLIAHFLFPPEGQVATGFLQYDQLSYMANAREHFDSGAFSLFYGLPFAADPDTPRLYFQPHTLLLGLAHHLSGLAPGHVYVGFGVLSGLLFIVVAHALYRQLFGPGAPFYRLGFVLFLWGGGLLALAGLAFHAAFGGDFRANLLLFDPFEGLWFLNLGRNLFYATESLYHALFLGAVLALFLGRRALALALAALLSASHPFTGIQLLSILGAWTLLEFLLSRRERPRLLRFGLGVAALTALHFLYYLWFLLRSPDHAALLEQWRLAWNLPALSALLAWGPVGLLALWRVRRADLFRETFGRAENRLLGVWFVVSLLLANHELFLTPHQPLHFTRGYVWTPLFLLGWPVLRDALESFARSRRLAGALAVSLLASVGLSDNALWFAERLGRASGAREAQGLYMPRELAARLRTLDRPENANRVLVTTSPLEGYFAAALTPLRPVLSHPFNTPEADARGKEIEIFVRTLQEPPLWRRRPLHVLLGRNDAAFALRLMAERGFTLVASGEAYILLAREGADPPADQSAGRQPRRTGRDNF